MADTCSSAVAAPREYQPICRDSGHHPPLSWRGNYTININLEENYWPAEVANLSELVAPVDGLVEGLSVTGRHNAQHFYGIDKGWCAGHNTDAWAMSNPVGTGNESPQWSNWAMGEPGL